MSNTSTFSLPAIEPVWHDAMIQRISRRRFDGESLAPELVSRARKLCERLSEQTENVRAVLVESPPSDVFTGLPGGYGRIQGEPAVIVFIAKGDSDVEVGFLGEAVILDATDMGLGTCWVAGTFAHEKAEAIVRLAEGESIRALTPLGYATRRIATAERLLLTAVRARSRLDLEQIAPENSTWPVWACEAANAVRNAPSGGNAQPWRLRMEGDALVVSRKAEHAYWTWKMDCGIVMLHAELGAEHAGVRGTWERLAEPDVACFTPWPADNS